MPSSDTTDPPAAQRWYSPAQAAAYAGLSTWTIYKHIREGSLPAYIPRGSRLVRILVDDLDAMVADARWSREASPAVANAAQRAPRRDRAGVIA